MLHVNTYIKQSEIHGTGLFAAESIPTGTVIWSYDPHHDRMFSQEEFDAFGPEMKKFAVKYMFKYNGMYCLCIDDAKFFNHSDDPNCMSAGYNAEFLGYTVAKRDIAVDEELTDDYNGFGLTEDDRRWENQKL